MPHLLDVRLPEDFDAGSLTGSVNHCVFEVGFLAGLPEGWSKDSDIRVIGSSPESVEARMALEKLERAGYSKVCLHDEAPPPATKTIPPPVTGTRTLDGESSGMVWTGRNLFNSHTGTLGFSAGELHFEGGQLTGGSMTIDFATLQCTDLAGTEMHDVLIRHLLDHDFFDAEHYDAPTIAIESVEVAQAVPPGAVNTRVSATLTLKGKSGPVRFGAVSGFGPDGRFALQGSLHFDRTEWGVVYGSGRLFKNVGMHLVNDLITLDVRLLSKA